jgi:hypothetical protein
MRYRVRSALVAITAAMLLGSGPAFAESAACKADLTGDGVVNFGDLAVLKSVFFQSCPRFEDRGLTVFDHQTGLEWEKKSERAGIHNWDNLYTWSTGTSNPDGTAFTVFLAALNGECVTESADHTTVSKGLQGYAGRCDWRLPTVTELNTIVDCSQPGPCVVGRIFGPTQADVYWSSSSYAGHPDLAWLVSFGHCCGLATAKTANFYVRAVRGGP